MNTSTIIGILVVLQILNVSSSPYIRQNYSSRDCHGLICPENTLKCVKNSVITENKDAMRSLISCVGKRGVVLMTKSILEPNERKDGPIRLHVVTTVIEVPANINKNYHGKNYY
ncbi:uncharacterized protein [Onthophagus taurus]|uniref:uncharacterized protein n=1 Tax=Onthophagus taurus TaxID=166361 RepID=UPI000C200171|nr:uncharacterized protein LOC111429499 [Onthophagus taurus]